MGSTLGEAVVAIEGDLSGLRTSFQAARQIAAAETTKLQQVINSQFKTAGVNFAPQLKNQMQQIQDWREDFQNELNQQKIGQHPDFLNALLPAGFSEQLKNRFEKAGGVWRGGLESLSSIWQNFRSTIMGKAGLAGIASFVVARVINSITEAHKIFRESEKGWRDYVNVWAESIPIIGNVARAIRGLAEEFSGLYEAQTKLKRATDFTKDMEDIGKGLQRALAMIGKSEGEQKRLDILNEYNDTLTTIETKEIAIKKTKEENAEIQKQINLLQAGGAPTGPIAKTKWAFGGSVEAEIARLKEKFVEPGTTEPEKRVAKELYDKKFKEIQDAEAAMRAKLPRAVIEKQETSIDSFVDSLKKLREESKANAETFGFLESKIKALALLKEALSKGFDVTELEKARNDIRDIEKSLAKIEKMEAFEQQKKQLEKYYNTLKEKALTPFERFKEEIKKMTLAWKEHYGTWAKYNEKAMAEYLKLYKIIRGQIFTEPEYTTIGGSGKYGEMFAPGNIGFQYGRNFPASAFEKPAVKKEVGFSGFKEMWFTMVKAMTGGKEDYAKRTAIATEHIEKKITNPVGP